MRARVAAGTDGVSVLLSTIETAACETPAAAAISFWVGRTAARLSRLPSRGLLVDAIIVVSYTYYKTKSTSRNIRHRDKRGRRHAMVPTPGRCRHPRRHSRSRFAARPGHRAGRTQGGYVLVRASEFGRSSCAAE